MCNFMSVYVGMCHVMFAYSACRCVCVVFVFGVIILRILVCLIMYNLSFAIDITTRRTKNGTRCQIVMFFQSLISTEVRRFSGVNTILKISPIVDSNESDKSDIFFMRSLNLNTM